MNGQVRHIEWVMNTCSMARRWDDPSYRLDCGNDHGRFTAEFAIRKSATLRTNCLSRPNGKPAFPTLRSNKWMLAMGIGARKSSPRFQTNWWFAWLRQVSTAVPRLLVISKAC